MVQSMKLNDTDILSLTRQGEQELREPGTTLQPVLLEALVLVGGSASVAQILKRAHNMAPSVLRSHLSDLIGRQLLSVNADQSGSMIEPGDFFSGVTHTNLSDVDAETHAKADADTEFLRRNSYYVNMARKRPAAQERTGVNRKMILAIEDDPDICKVLQICLKLEGFETRTAGNRDEILAAFRNPPLPGLVLLDVKLTDVNGFDILTRMRQHPVLKDMPVVMLTASASREAVLRGIIGGADGFITKPFQIPYLIKAIKTVLGMPQ